MLNKKSMLIAGAVVATASTLFAGAAVAQEGGLLGLTWPVWIGIIAITVFAVALNDQSDSD